MQNPPAQGYVMLSRVQSLEQLIILDDFKSDKIYPDQKALAEVKRMDAVCVNNNMHKFFPTWHTPNECTRIAFFNTFSLKKHINDIRNDSTLLQSDIMCISETWLDDCDRNCDFGLDHFQGHFIKIGKGKGITTYYKDMFHFVDEVKQPLYQIAKFSCKDFDVISVYRSAGGDIAALTNHLCGLIDHGKCTVVVGDFNLCYRSNPTNKLTTKLLNLSFVQQVHNPTFKCGSLLDHCYTRMLSQILPIEHHSLYWSDHDALLFAVLPNLM